MSEPAEQPAENQRVDAAAGRGVVFIGIAKIYFMVAGLAIETLLPRLLGPVRFGIYGWVNSAVSVLNTVIVTGTIQTVSRATVTGRGQEGAVKATGLRMQLGVGLPLAILFAAAAPVAVHLNHDPALLLPMLAASLILAGNSLYAVFVGSANGTGQFRKQASLDMCFATLRALALIGAAFVTGNVFVVFGAWTTAVVVVLILSAVWVGGPGGARATSVRPMLAFMGAMVAYQALFALLTATDTILLKPLATHWFVAHGQLTGASDLASAQVGFYRNAQTIARLPWQLMLAVTFVIFPLMSGATFSADKGRAREYVRTTMRYSLVFAGLIGAVLAANGSQVVRLIAPTHPGGWCLPVLTLGHVTFALFSIGGTILNAAGRARSAIVGCLVTVILLAVSLFIVLPRFEPGAPLLLAAACCTAGAMLLGTLITGAQLLRAFGEFLPLATVLRVAAAVAAVLFAAHGLELGGGLVMIAVGSVLSGLIYLLVLVLTFELRRADLGRVTAIIVRRKKS
jgi:O-antigen/teichoic acid export membrane protein